MYWSCSVQRGLEDMVEETYRSYFDIDENYFPQVTESAIEKSEDLWKRTYPHGKFDIVKNS